MYRASSAIIAIASIIACGHAASAADLPLKAPPPAAISPGSWYVWIDGMYENVRLPSYALGIQNRVRDGAGFRDVGPGQKFDRKLDGEGVRGTLGYTMPGSGIRFELGGSYVTAKASSSQPTALAIAVPVLLNGVTPGSILGGFLCDGTSGFTCATTSALDVSYAAWRIDGKLAADRKLGAVTVSPFVAIFGGNTRDSDHFSQAFRQFDGTGAVFRTGSYAASTELRWQDVGARLGVDLSVPLAGSWTLGASGSIAGADRMVSLSGSDLSSFPTIAAFNGASVLSANDNRSVFLANAELSLAYAFNSILRVRGFAGLNYDGGVPGIAPPGPTATPTPFGAPPIPGPAAGIAHSAETSFYAGASIGARF